MTAIMRLHHQVMRVRIEMDIICEYSDVLITEDLGHFFEWNSLGLRQEEVHNEEAQAGDDDEDEVEFPADVGEGLYLLVGCAYGGVDGALPWR